MTKEEILAMEVGIDLDCNISDVVFNGKTFPLFSGIKHYSTNISAAWQVWLAVTKGAPEDWAIYSDSDGKVTVEHYHNDYKGDREEGCGDIEVNGLFPEAMCKAALLAKLGGN